MTLLMRSSPATCLMHGRVREHRHKPKFLFITDWEQHHKPKFVLIIDWEQHHKHKFLLIKDWKQRHKPKFLLIIDWEQHHKRVFLLIIDRSSVFIDCRSDVQAQPEVWISFYNTPLKTIVQNALVESGQISNLQLKRRKHLKWEDEESFKKKCVSQSKTALWLIYRFEWNDKVPFGSFKPLAGIIFKCQIFLLNPS